MKEKKFTDKEIHSIIGKMSYISDKLEVLGYINQADAIEDAREVIKYLLKIKNKIDKICDDKS